MPTSTGRRASKERTTGPTARSRQPVPPEGGLEMCALDASSLVGFLEVTPDGHVRRVNACLVHLLGAASERELVGRTLTDLVVGRSSWRAWHASALAGRERGVTLAFQGPGGHSALLKGDLFRPRNAADESLVGLFVDVSEEMRLKEALQRGARREALGSLTSGIAHDFNNLLTVLVGNLYLAAEELREDDMAFQRLKAARDAAKRGADLIKQLLAFARRESLEAEDVDPAKVIAGLAPLVRLALGARITLDARPSAHAGRVRCNAAQLESAIVNLAVNARDAIADRGRIVIGAEAVHLGRAEALRRRVPPGTYVRLSVADNGSGIAPEALERVFEPFYTTKTERGGTGLGLSMVRWFAEQSGGSVSIDSAPGRGTVVSVLLPRATDTTSDPLSMTAPLSTLPGGEEAVAVLACDENVRSTIEQTLAVLGYDVCSAGSPEETLALLRRGRAQMLVVDGAAQDNAARRRFLEAAATARPGIAVVMTVDGAEAARETAAPGEPWLLAKPFSIADVARVVRRALDRASDRGPARRGKSPRDEA